jgi:two-component system, sensor histidine kinase and response regulator
MYKLRVFIVDDEQGMRMGMHRSLNNFNLKLPEIDDSIQFELDMAETGTEALEKISAHAPDILLLDYKLPDLTGLEILEKIKLQGEDSPLTIMVTAYASLETAVSAIKSGAYDFLAKPFTPSELRATISKAAQSLILARQVKKLSEERKQVRFQFISVLGHELKAPLGAIEGYLNMMDERISGTDLENYSDMIKRCLIRTEQMKKLIIDLLEMTKIESGNRTRDLTDIDLVEIANQSIENMISDAKKRNIEINLECCYPMRMIADREEIEIILNNLVTNAVKYNRDNGKVDVIIFEEAGLFTIQVKDTGIGMTPDECARLFKEFVRIKNAKTRMITGSGLGLSTIKKVAQLYYGDVTVESQPDVGTTFTVSLNNAVIDKSIKIAEQEVEY